MTPIGNAQQMWDNPTELIELWKDLDSKHYQEHLIAKLAGKVKVIGDLGCGVGRFADVLDFEQYYGYDASHQMVSYAIANNSNPKVEFSCLDIFKFGSDLFYDTIICVDVLIHLSEPIKAIQTIFRNWDAHRYIFTLLVGSQEELFNSIVINQDEFEKFCLEFKVNKLHRELVPNERFEWVVCELKK